MHRLFRLLHRWKCKNAAQKLALDALLNLPEKESNSWQGLFLWNVESLLRGVDAPEREFRDYSNHVLYAHDDWGGAARLARKWYWRTVESLRSSEWSDAAYHAGVLCRYSSFPFMPLRTSHDEVGLSRSAPVEWTISQLYDQLTPSEIKAARPEMPEGNDWLEELLVISSIESNQYFQIVKDKFDLPAVVKDPRSLDDELSLIFGQLLSQARATLGIILGRAINESGAEPPHYPLGLAAAFAIPSLPIFWLTRSQSAAADWKIISAISREFTQSGEIKASLPASAVALRDAYAIEVLKTSPVRPSVGSPEVEGTDETQPHKLDKPNESSLSQSILKPSRRKPHLGNALISETSPPSAATSMSVELANGVQSLGIQTIRDLLAADAEEVASALGPIATAMDVVAWQDEARLCCELQGLEPAEAQLLVACGVTGADDLAALEPVELWELVSPVAESPDGRRLLDGDTPPDLDTVTRWINAANRLKSAA